MKHKLDTKGAPEKPPKEADYDPVAVKLAEELAAEVYPYHKPCGDPELDKYVDWQNQDINMKREGFVKGVLYCIRYGTTWFSLRRSVQNL